MFIGILALGLFFLFYFLNSKNRKVKVESGENKTIQIATKKVIDHKENNVKSMLNFGVLLIIISSFVFATSTWNFIDDLGKVIFLSFETLLFMGLGLLLKHLFKIEKTSSSLIFISCVLVGIVFLSVGYFGMFGDSFSTYGGMNSLFFASIFLLEFLVFYIRMTINKSKSYFIILLLFILYVFTFINYLTNSIAISIALVSSLMLIINIIKDKIFEKSVEFNILNILISTFTTFSFFILTFYFLLGNGFENENLSLFLILITLCLNVTYSINKYDGVGKVLSVIYDFLLVSYLGLFSGSVLTSAFLFAIFSIGIYAFYYLSSNRNGILASLIASYVSSLIAIVLFYFNSESLLFATALSAIFIGLNIISSIRDKNYKTCNTIMQPMFLITLVISVILQPNIFNHLNFSGVLFIINLVLFLVLLVNFFQNKTVKKGYLFALMLTLFIQCVTSYSGSLLYIVACLVINVLILCISYFGKDLFLNKCSFSLMLLLIFNTISGLSLYFIVKFILVTILLVLGYLFTREEKRKYLYLSSFYVPLIMLTKKIFPASNAISSSYNCTLLVPFLILFTRKYLSFKRETDLCAFELIFLSFILISINDVFLRLIVLIISYLFAYIFSKKRIYSGNIYNNYLLFLTPFTFISFSYEKLIVIYILSSLVFMIINQLMIRYFDQKRNCGLEVAHSLITLGLIRLLISHLKFNNFLSFIVSIVFLLIIYFTYNDNRVKSLVISFIIYPLSFLINNINSKMLASILDSFIILIPIIILNRFVFKLKDKTANIIEVITLSIIYLSYIFKIDILVAVTLGIISILLIILGTIFNYKSLSGVGYVGLLATVIIQTSFLWGKVPWWLYLLLAGIILIIYATIKESKK